MKLRNFKLKKSKVSQLSNQENTSALIDFPEKDAVKKQIEFVILENLMKARLRRKLTSIPKSHKTFLSMMANFLSILLFIQDIQA
jgi:hypothetical protein